METLQEFLGRFVYCREIARVLGFALPTCRLRMRHPEVVKNAKDEMIYKLLDRTRPVIEPGTGRNDMGAGVR